ncbi:MAG TPA: rhodanese-like domain-containing protein [Verrucomicrobiae bacterium]|nr:rhodanese-like domain-containing protein [Verrucomicrobiae bacterium]
MIKESKQSPRSISVAELARVVSAGHSVNLLDVRTPAEHGSVHIPGSRLSPLDQLSADACLHERKADDNPLYVLCQSGSRARRAIERLEQEGIRNALLVEGGIQAWIDAGLPVVRGTSQVLPLMRQVQVVVGLISAAGAILALAVDLRFAVIPLLMGAGLLFAGLTGTCGLALVLARMPWNQTSLPPQPGCCGANRPGDL